MRALLVLCVIACGGKPTPKPVVETPAPPLPWCVVSGAVPLVDGKLACRELPISVTFPAGIKVTRQLDRAMSMFNADLERGVMALIVEPRHDTPDAKLLGDLLVTIVKSIVADSTTSSVEAPKLEGAAISAGVAFTTPGDGVGVVHGYAVNHFWFAVIVGGTKPESKPDTPLAKAFLSSIEVRPLATGSKRYELAAGARLELPATAWATGLQSKQDGVISDVIHIIPDRGIWIGVRELEMRDRCDYLKGTVAGASEDIGERMKSIYGGAQMPLENIAKASYGDISAYAEVKTGASRVVMYLICTGKTVVQLTVVGSKPPAELRPHLDEVAKSLVGAT
jgi:hypothetical protein